MRALTYHRYGDRSVMSVEDLPDPGAPRGGDVRVRVVASSVNPVDGKVRRGELKLVAGGHFPKRPGLDFCGEVEAIGEDVSGLKVGDPVYGAARNMSEGAFAEYVLVHAAAIAKQPSTIDQTTAAGVPTVATAALQVLRDVVRLAPGERILVNGCTGGVGIFAIQMARQSGAIVTGVCGTAGVALAHELGADEVFDYKRGDEPGGGTKYRAILELSGKLSFDAAQEHLDEHGLYVDFSPSPAALVGNTIANSFRSKKHVFAMTGAKTADLEFIAGEIDAGRLRCAPTRVFPLERFADAFALAEGGGVVGKVVVRVGH